MTAEAATLFAYIIAGVFFILTLRGLSSPTSARQGNTLGMIGMTICHRHHLGLARRA